jgi:hypothetical protein
MTETVFTSTASLTDFRAGGNRRALGTPFVNGTALLTSNACVSAAAVQQHTERRRLQTRGQASTKIEAPGSAREPSR